MPNTPSRNDVMLPANDRAVVRYLGDGYAKISRTLAGVIEAIDKGSIEEAQFALAFVAHVCDVSADRATRYLAGAPGVLHASYFDNTVEATAVLPGDASVN